MTDVELGWRFWVPSIFRTTLVPPFMLAAALNSERERRARRGHPNPCGPYSEGWLAWLFRQLEVRSPQIMAACKHGNVAPSPKCACGVHYYRDVTRFLSRYPSTPGIATLGYTIGTIAADYLYRDDPNCGRAAGYEIRGVLVASGTDQHVINGYTDRYDVPVLPEGVCPAGIETLRRTINPPG